MCWMLVTWAVEGLPGKTVADGKQIFPTLQKMLLERFLIGFFGGFSVNVIMHMIAEEPVAQTGDVKQELKEAAHRAAHPCGGASAQVSACPQRAA